VAARFAVEETKTWTSPTVPDMTLMRARFVQHEFPRHFHDTYVVQVVEEGHDEFYCKGKNHLAGPGHIVVIEPREIHSGRPFGGYGLAYRSFYPFILGDSAQAFEECVIKDQQCAKLLLDAHKAAEKDEDRLAASCLWVEAVSKLIENHSKSVLAEAVVHDPVFVRKVAEILEDRLAEQITLAELAYECCYSPFHLLRMFRASTGVAPHQYLVAVRVERAKPMLRKGKPIAEVAADLGFADQAHLTRHFKRLVGVTPGAYRG
jgi:AraC-like DNA-binding protein